MVLFNVLYNKSFFFPLGRMSDHESSVRQISTHCFATLIQLMPLDGAVPNPPMMTTTLVQQKDKDKAFLEQLFNPKTIPDYVVPVKIYAELRSYQQVSFFLHACQLNFLICFFRVNIT